MDILQWTKIHDVHEQSQHRTHTDYVQHGKALLSLRLLRYRLRCHSIQIPLLLTIVWLVHVSDDTPCLNAPGSVLIRKFEYNIFVDKD